MKFSDQGFGDAQDLNLQKQFKKMKFFLVFTQWAFTFLREKKAQKMANNLILRKMTQMQLNVSTCLPQIVQDMCFLK